MAKRDGKLIDGFSKALWSLFLSTCILMFYFVKLPIAEELLDDSAAWRKLQLLVRSPT